MEELNRICEELARIAKALGADEPEIEREAERRLREQANREAFIRSSRDFLPQFPEIFLSPHFHPSGSSISIVTVSEATNSHDPPIIMVASLHTQ